jgi:RHS repeat-associated protein
LLPARAHLSPRMHWRNRRRVRRCASGRSHYNYFRDYDPATGRYVESDPSGLAGGSYSTYAYVGGNPTSNVDPLGLETGPAYHAIYTWDLPPQKGCDGTCKGADRIEMTFSDSACDSSDTNCFLAMQAAGLSHPPRTVAYSASCLIKMGVIVKPGGYAGSEAFRRGVPWAAARMGASEGVVGALSRGLSWVLGPESLLFWVPVGLSGVESECECNK